MYHWMEMEFGGEGFAYEEPPVGCGPVPSDAVTVNACFATSWGTCEKKYLIVLEEMNIKELVNSCKPPITFIDW